MKLYQLYDPLDEWHDRELYIKKPYFLGLKYKSVTLIEGIRNRKICIDQLYNRYQYIDITIVYAKKEIL